MQVSNVINCSIECQIDGKHITFPFSHPKVSEARVNSIRRFLDMGCELVPDVEELPDWLKNVPSQFQRAVLETKPEVFNYYQLRIPAKVRLEDEDWAALVNISEIKHLSVSSEFLMPSNMFSLAYLEKLEILVIHTAAFDDSHCFVTVHQNRCRREV